MTETKKLEVYCRGDLVGYLAETPDHLVAFHYGDSWVRNGWRLAPAYDLTYSDTYWGEQTTSVNGKGKDISDKDLIKVGTDAGLTKPFCIDCLSEIKEKTGILTRYFGNRKYRKAARIPPAERITELRGVSGDGSL